MDRVPYTIELRGLDAAPGTIDATALRDLLGAIIDASGRVLRLSVEGTSTRRGPKPEWMTDSTRFLITGLQEGSTIVPIEAPRLSETAKNAVQQQDLWQSKPDADRTALTLLGEALGDIQRDERESPRYDRGVLSAVGAFGRLIGNGEQITIRHAETNEIAFDVSHTHIQQAERLKRDTPAPFSVVLTGNLDTIEYSQRSFELLTDEGDTIRGAVESPEITPQDVRELWGEDVTIQGQAHFTPAGSLRFVETSSLRPARPEDDLFRQSKSDIEEQAAHQRPLQEQDLSAFGAGADIRAIRGTWPGDESIDEILDALD